MQSIPHITVRELKEQQETSPAAFVLLDIREDFERDICVLDNDQHIPMNQVPQRLSELDKNKKIYVYCRSGQRSFGTALFLIEQGFEAYNVEGGILDWAREIDQNLNTY